MEIKHIHKTIEIGLTSKIIFTQWLHAVNCSIKQHHKNLTFITRAESKPYRASLH